MAIQKINAGSVPNSTVRELWIGDTIEELKTAIESYNICYPEMGYGTFFQPIQPCESVAGVKHYAGKFFTNMSRMTSCD